MGDELFRFFQIESSKFDKILDDPHLSIENLLDEETIINEFRGCNPRLLQKMRNFDFNKMVKFIIEEPSELDDQKRQFKYPFIACELLTCNIGLIPEQFFDREPLAIDDEESEAGENEMNIEEDHSDTHGEQHNGIQIKESLSDTSEEDNDELNKPPNGRVSMTGEQLSKLGQEEMDIEKEEEEQNGENTLENHKHDSTNEAEVEQTPNEQVEAKQSSPQQQHLEDNKNEMDISQEMINADQPQQGKVIEEQITQKAEEIFSETILQVQEEKLKQEQMRNELEKKYEKIPQDKMYLFGLLLSFFDAKKEINITLAGYVAKVFQHLFSIVKNKSKENDVVDYLFLNEQSLLNMTYHMHSRSCAEILVKCLTFSSSSQKGKYLTTKLKVIDRLIDLISDEKNDLEVFANSVFALSELINIYTNYVDGKQMLEYIVSTPVLTRIFNNIISPSSKVVFNNANIVCTLIQLFNVIEARRTDDEENQFKEFDISFKESLELMSTYVKPTIDYLKNYEQEETINTVYREQLKPLGQARLKIIEIYCLALKLESFEMVQEIAQHNLHSVLLELFLAYEWNNMLHTLVERIIVQSAQINSHAIRKAVFTDAKLINFLLRATREVDSAITDPTAQKIAFRKGYLGHVTNIANFVQRLCDNNPDIQEYVDLDEWQSLRDSFLDTTNKNNNRDLGDHSKIDHDSPQSQLHCSYDIEEIKLKSEDFLFGISHFQTDKVHDEEEDHMDQQHHHQEEDEQENKESDDMFFSNIAKSIHDDEENDEDKKNQNNFVGWDAQNNNGNSTNNVDPFAGYNMTTSEEKKPAGNPFDAFGFFDMPAQQNPVETQEKKAQFDDFFKSFEATTSPQISPQAAQVDLLDINSLDENKPEQQQQAQQQQQDNSQNANSNNNNTLDFFNL